MTEPSPPGTLLDLPLIEERYGWSLVAAISLHALLIVFFAAVPFLLPKPTALQIGTGPGGGLGGDIYTVGVADDLGGGAGLFKPATTPQAPAPPPVEKPAKKEVSKEDANAIPLPDAAAKNRKKVTEPATKAVKSPGPATSNQIPDPDAKGAGGVGGAARGSGGGMGGGIGISIGSGTGGIGDSYYARAVEARVGGNWSKPDVRQRIEIAYTFLVQADGTITDITLVKSCGNSTLDNSAYRAILVSSPLTRPPPEFRGRPLLFTAQFIYPPDKD